MRSAAASSTLAALWLLLAVSQKLPLAGADSGHQQGAVVVGVDYYPEQWPLDEMPSDMRSIKEDLGADIVRIGEFMWQHIEPADGRFNFTLTDAIMNEAEKNGLRVMLGTPTATMPAWLHQAHPDVVMKGPDSPEGYGVRVRRIILTITLLGYSGATPSFGGRRQYSFNSDTYLRLHRALIHEMHSQGIGVSSREPGMLTGSWPDGLYA